MKVTRYVTFRATVGVGVGCPRGNAHSTRLAICRHFAAFAELFSLLFLVVSFQDSLTLEEPAQVLKVGLYICACRVACGEVDWYKANFRL